MSVARVMFDERVADIERYFSFIEEIIDHQATLVFPLPIGTKQDVPRLEKLVPIELKHTLKANGFLLLYNLVEATVSNAIEEIHT